MSDDNTPKTYTEDEVRALIDKETGGLKAKVDELLSESKGAKQKARELEDEKARAEEERQREKGEFKTLYEREQKAKQELADKFGEFQSKVQRQEISLASAKIAGQLAKDTQRAELLAEKIGQLAKHTDDGVIFEIGGVTVDTDKVVAHLVEKYPFLIDASGANGGGAPGNNPGGRAAPKGDMGGDREARKAAIAARFKLSN